ncbi:MAG: xylose isomerase [Acidobacteria bacterium]|nr:MAG: xylose isomerase [Acidobacteriota bacterium]
MSDYARREFLLAIGALGVGASGSLRLEATGRIRLGYAAITWGGKDEQAIADISAVGFKAIQLRSSAFDAYGTRPGVLKDLLAKHGLTFAILSSGDLKYQPADREAMLALHLSHAKFVRDAGGQFLQVIDELPKGRAVGPDDYKALADMLNTLGERTKAIGVPLVYHNHMNSTGEAPDAIEAIMAESAASSVGLLFDIAHYQQAGGDPVKAIRRYGKAIKAVHLKDVRKIDAAPGYQWVELGRGRVDVKGSVAALKDVGFDGWAIVEFDRVVDPGGSPKASAEANREYVTKQLGLML